MSETNELLMKYCDVFKKNLLYYEYGIKDESEEIEVWAKSVHNQEVNNE